MEGAKETEMVEVEETVVRTEQWKRVFTMNKIKWLGEGVKMLEVYGESGAWWYHMMG